MHRGCVIESGFKFFFLFSQCKLVLMLQHALHKIVLLAILQVDKELEELRCQRMSDFTTASVQVQTDDIQ